MITFDKIQCQNSPMFVFTTDNYFFLIVDENVFVVFQLNCVLAKKKYNCFD